MPKESVTKRVSRKPRVRRAASAPKTKSTTRAKTASAARSRAVSRSKSGTPKKRNSVIEEHLGETPGVDRGSEGHGGGYTDYRRRSHGGGFIGGDGMVGTTDYDYDREE